MFTGQIEVGGRVDVSAGAVVKAVRRSVDQLEGVVDRYANERRERVCEAGAKASQGRIIDAAMDALQMFSLGGFAADAAKASGLVRGGVEQNAVAAIVNGLLGGPLGKLAALGDAEDALQAALPRLREITDRGVVSGDLRVPCAPSQHVPSPSKQYAKRLQVKGYRSSARAKASGAISFQSLSPAQRHRLLDSFRLGIMGRFAIDLPLLGLSINGQIKTGAGRGGRVQPSASGGGATGSVFDDPSISFEDKLFLFMLMVAKNQEQKMEKLMKKYDSHRAREEKKKKNEAKVGQMQAKLNIVGSVAGSVCPVAAPIIAGLSSSLSELPEMAQKFDDLKASASGDEGTLSSKEQKYSEQRWMLELEKEQQKLTRVYNLISNIMKAGHDTQMNAIRNMR